MDLVDCSATPAASGMDALLLVCDILKPAPGKALPSGPRYWTDTEHAAFVVGLNKYGRNWSRISTEVGTRTPVQVCSHAQTHFDKILGVGYEKVPTQSTRESRRAKSDKERKEEQAAIDAELLNGTDKHPGSVTLARRVRLDAKNAACRLREAARVQRCALVLPPGAPGGSALSPSGVLSSLSLVQSLSQELDQRKRKREDQVSFQPEIPLNSISPEANS
jgi:SHAQKYF class myb-like DNA-binding protein